jgi:LPS sulfotransferase NodH
MDGIRRQHSTENGVFGVQVGYRHLKFALEAASLEQLFGRAPVWFYLRRENFVRQGISFYLSTESGYWHVHQQGEKERQRYDAVAYDAHKIEKWCRHIIKQEGGFEAIFREHCTEPVRLIYEDVVRHPRRATRLMTNVMGVTSTHAEEETESSVRAISTERSSEWETRFRDDRTAVVEELSAIRREQLG